MVRHHQEVATGDNEISAGLLVNEPIAGNILLLQPLGCGRLLRVSCSTAIIMAKPHHKLKKANHGQRPANGKARKAKRKKVKT